MPDRMLRNELVQWLDTPLHEWCGERRSPKVQPLIRPGIEPRTFWLVVRDLTNSQGLFCLQSDWEERTIPIAGLNNKHLKSVAIWASDCQDLPAQLQRVLTRSKIERSQFKFCWLCFYGYSLLRYRLRVNLYVCEKCCFSIVIFCACLYCNI